jgi:hypothetical protein
MSARHKRSGLLRTFFDGGEKKSFITLIPGGLSLLHGGGDQEAAGQDGSLPRDWGHRVAEEGRQQSQRHRFQVRRTDVEAHRGRGSSQT